jgi:hypothetical protein
MHIKSFLLGLGLMATFGATPAPAGDRAFHEIVRRLSVAYQKKPMPFMGFVSFVARFAQPQGVSGLKIALFEGVDPSHNPDAARFDALVEGVAGADYHPMVRVRSKGDGDETYVYVRDAGSGFEMLVVNLEPSEAVVAKMHLNPQAMEGWMDHPIDQGGNWFRHSRSDDGD